METPPIFENLSDRELDVLELLATGASNKEIASELSISQNTVKVHLRNIYAKTGSSSRTEAAMQAVRQGLIPPMEAAEVPHLAGETSSLGPWDIVFRFRWVLAGLLGASLLATILLVGWSLQNAANQQPENGPGAIAVTAPPRWQERSALPVPRRGLAVLSFENHIFAIGGEGPEGITGRVDQYDPASDRWREGSSKPVPVADVAAAVVGGRIFVPGGRLQSGQQTDVLAIYDPRTDEWSTGSPLPAALSRYALAAFEGRLYLFGGWDGSEAVNSVFSYVPDRDEWQTLESLPEPVEFATAATAGGAIYILGGRTETGPIAANYLFLPDRLGTTDPPFEPRSPMPDVRYGMGVADIADILHIAGGEGPADNLPALRYFPDQDAWEAFDLPVAGNWAYLGASSIGSDFYLMGGLSGGTLEDRHVSYKAFYTVAIPIFNR